MERGEITAYLSLIFILLVSLVGAVAESASIQNAKNYRRADMNRAMECLFAEYQKELLEKYDIFALEGSYETGVYEEAKLFDRLTYYGAGDMEQDLLRVQFLTDQGCRAFYEQAAAYAEHKYGIDRAKEYLGRTDIWRQQKEASKDYEKAEADTQEELSALLEENEGELPSENNPIHYVDTLKKSPLLELVMPKEMQVSDKSIPLSELLSHRARNQGFGDFTDVPDLSDAISALLFGEYVKEHFPAAADGEKTGVLDYQMEYILEGRGSDRENLEAVAKKLLALRFVPNYGYLQTDGEKKAEAEALALTLCTLLQVPAIVEAVSQMILLAWAYGESVLDIRVLLKGGRVPFVKSGESWQLQLSSLMTLGTEGDQNDGIDREGGISYKEYLGILLFLKGKEEKGTRALDLIEQNLRAEYGQEYFRADQCISKMEISSVCTFRRGISYRFSTYFGYN